MGQRKKPQPKTDPESQRKPFRPTRVRMPLAEAADLWLEAKPEYDFTRLVNEALREKLERDQFWPPKARDCTSD